MKIIVDARAISVSPRGIGQFLINALCAMATQQPEWQLIVCSNKPIHPDALLRLQSHSNITYQIKHYNRSIVWFLLHFPKVLKAIKPNYVWYPATAGLPLKVKGVKILTTVHDVVSIEYRHTMSLPNKIASKLFFDSTIKNSDLIWSVSNYTKEMVEKYFPNRKAKDIVVGSSINTDFFKKLELSSVDKAKIRDSHNCSLDSKLLLFVGTLEPRKNLKFLLSLMPKLSTQGYELLIVGGKGWGKTDISNIINSDGFPSQSVHFAGYVSDYELLEIYNTVDCFVSTSLNEGFGMPQLEAVFCGCAVVTADNSAMREVVSGAGCLVDGWNIDQWCDAIIQSSNHSVNTIESEKKIAEYQWSNIAQRIIAHIHPLG